MEDYAGGRMRPRGPTEFGKEHVMQSLSELKTRAEKIELYSYSTNDDRCDNCRYYKLMREGIGYCAHRDVDMVVGAPWWCSLWEADANTAKARSSG